LLTLKSGQDSLNPVKPYKSRSEAIMQNKFPNLIRISTMVLATIAAILALLTGCGEEDNPANNFNTGNGQIAYIYQPQEGYTTPAQFKTFLENRGYPTDLISVADIIPDNFSEFILPDYSLIIIDSDIGDQNEWGDSVRVALIKLCDRPVIGLGFGGVRLFTEMDLFINWYNCAEFSRNSDPFHTELCVSNINPENVIIDTTSAVFTTPNDIRFVGDTLIDLHRNAALIAFDYTTPDMPDSLIFYGRQPNSTKYYSIILQGKYLMWGFASSPDEMRDSGLNFFENMVSYLIGNTP
jgi:hypothetical protein